MREKGFTANIILLMVALVLLVIGGALFFSRSNEEVIDNYTPPVLRKFTKKASTAAPKIEPTLSASDELTDIDRDLQNTSTDSIDQELVSVNKDSSGM